MEQVIKFVHLMILRIDLMMEFIDFARNLVVQVVKYQINQTIIEKKGFGELRLNQKDLIQHCLCFQARLVDQMGFLLVDQVITREQDFGELLADRKDLK